MYISTDRYRRRDRLDVGFFDEDGADEVTEGFHVCFGEMFAAFELGYPSVGVRGVDRHFLVSMRVELEEEGD